MKYTGSMKCEYHTTALLKLISIEKDQHQVYLTPYIVIDGW